MNSNTGNRADNTQATKPSLSHILVFFRVQELCESRDDRPGPYGLCGRKATVKLQNSVLSGVKVEVAVLGSKSLTVPTVSVNVKILKNTK